MVKTDTETQKVYESYDFQKHSYCMVIHMDDEYITTKHFLNKLEGFSSQEKYSGRGKACITYNEEKNTVLDWGENPTFNPPEGSMHISNFMDRIRTIYEKCSKAKKTRLREMDGKDNIMLNEENELCKDDENCEEDKDGEADEDDGHDITNKADDIDKFKGFAEFHCFDEEDKFFLNAVSEFFRLKFNESFDYYEITQKSNDAFHYIFIAPSSWDKKIGKWILRPLFINSGIITKEDHKDRILFLTDLETIFYHLQNQEYTKMNNDLQVFKKGDESVLCRVASKRDGTVSIEFDLIAPQNSQLDVSEAILFPRVLKSGKVSLSLEYFKEKVRNFIEKKMIEDETEVCEHEILDRIVDFVLSYFSQRKYFYSRKITDYSNYYMFKTTNLTDWQLNDAQTKIIQSIEVNHIFNQIDEDKTIEKEIVNITNSIKKRRTLVLAHQYFSFNEQVPHLVPWLEKFLEYHKDSLEYSIIPVTSGYNPGKHISLPNMMAGATTRTSQVLRNANIHALPVKLHQDRSKVSRESPSSIFFDKKQNATIIMDISLEATLISYSSLNDFGVIEDVYDSSHDEAIQNILHPLSKFFDGANLKVNKDVILFIKEYLAIDLEYFSKYDRRIKRASKSGESNQPSESKGKKLPEYFFRRKSEEKYALKSKIENLLNADSSTEENIFNTQQQKYIRTFLLLYIFYLNEVILSAKPEGKSLNVGYVISVEKMLMNKLICTKEDFKEIVLASGVVQETDPTKKLKVITRGEELSASLQQTSGLELSCKSYFVLFQLHEDYMYFTLNQVVGDADSDNKESSIIIEEKIFPIQNIYKSLFMNIWKHLTRKGNFIKRCNNHDDDDNFLEFTSCEAKNLFVIFKKYVEENIIQESLDPLSKNQETIHLNSSDTCKCSINFSTEDVMDLAFVPTFKEIATTVFSVIANKDESGNYMDIRYVFGLIYFNRNREFQKILADLLQYEVIQFTEGKEIEVECFVVQELPCQFLRPKKGQRSLLYQEFQVGSLIQVSSETYGFFATHLKGAVEEINCSYIDRKTKKTVTKMYKNHVFPLLKKGEAINSLGLNKTFFLDSQRETKQTFNITLYKLKKMDNVKGDERVPIATNFWDELKNFTLMNYERGSNIPIMIYMKSNVYDPVLDFSVKFVGQDITFEKDYCVKVGEPLTIARH